MFSLPHFSTRSMLYVTCLIATLCSCATDRLESQLDDSIIIEEQYELYTHVVNDELSQTLHSIDSAYSRSRQDTYVGFSLFNYFISIPISKIDSVLNNLDEESLSRSYNTDAFDLQVDALGLASTRKIYDFAESYIDSGGHNMETLKSYAYNEDAEMQKCLTIAASTIDSFLPQDGRMITMGKDYCGMQLLREIAVMAVSDEVVRLIETGLALPEFDVLGCLIIGGAELYDAYKAVKDYHECKIKYIS